jgi:hypothetical protein
MSEVLSTSFNIISVDAAGKKFDKVSRFVGKSLDQDITIELDYHSDLITIDKGDEIYFVLSFTNEPNDISQYNYGMNGKLFKIEESQGKNAFYSSFGGLLLKLDCPNNIFSKIKSGSNCRLFLKRKK